jgi:hypothetical protein
VHFEKSRAELGPGFIRILSYFREDGAKSVAQIEQAMHEQNTVALVIPGAHAEGRIAPVRRRAAGRIAELIETPRASAVRRNPPLSPTSWCPRWSSFAALFNETVELFDKATNPLLTARARDQRRAGGFGRKVSATRASAGSEADRDRDLRNAAVAASSHSPVRKPDL